MFFIFRVSQFPLLIDGERLAHNPTEETGGPDLGQGEKVGVGSRASTGASTGLLQGTLPGLNLRGEEVLQLCSKEIRNID